ncbi:hypothetical protein AO715_12885 [Xanthomonas sp. Mitacek01]|nr:hypothetical protein AO715_12885 [Xanthomonas sp. Mitacek01]
MFDAGFEPAVRLLRRFGHSQRAWRAHGREPVVRNCPCSPSTTHKFHEMPGFGRAFSFPAFDARDSNLRFACCAGPALRGAQGVRESSRFNDVLVWTHQFPPRAPTGFRLQVRQLRSTLD